MRTARPRSIRFVWLSTLLVAPAFFLAERTAHAEDVILTIDSSQSNETWSGIDNTYGVVQPQSNGSLTTAVEGHFVVDFDPTTDTPTSIQFIGNNNDGYFQLDNNNQSFAPGGAGECRRTGRRRPVGVRHQRPRLGLQQSCHQWD